MRAIIAPNDFIAECFGDAGLASSEDEVRSTDEVVDRVDSLRTIDGTSQMEFGRESQIWVLTSELWSESPVHRASTSATRRTVAIITSTPGSGFSIHERRPCLVVGGGDCLSLPAAAVLQVFLHRGLQEGAVLLLEYLHHPCPHLRR